MAIFQKSVVEKFLSELEESVIDSAYSRFKEVYSVSRISEIKTLKEEQYQEGFVRDIFVEVLGYTLQPESNYNIELEKKNETDSKKADGAILKDGNVIGVIELKDNKTKSLDKVKDQAFGYKVNHKGCKYVITSNFQKLRLYVDDATEYEEFDLYSLDREEFARFYLFLSKEGLLDKDTAEDLKEQTKFHEEDITTKLYKDYSSFKHKFYSNIVKKNPQYDKLILFKKSQKFLDRILFILFSEDKKLIPENAISRIVDSWEKADDLHYKPLYELFKILFTHLNTGYKYKSGYEIPAYNGGLFIPDEVLDNISVDDDILKDDLLILSKYDFNTEVDVNILGHIFEHSLTELEEIEAEIKGEVSDVNKGKRKKEGVFYTPKYITKYIVENTIGKLCSEKKEELKISDFDVSEYQNRNGKVNSKGKELFNLLETYKKWLFELKILDPACGSGAFLNQALDFLIDEHKFIDDLIAELTNTPLRLFDTDKTILEKNIFGVDINEESVEIAKLSLWLRTAQRGRKLSNLSSNIKCGNSLISDVEVAGSKAFDWKKEFSEVFEKGGFDVVIGNPPYVKARDNDDIAGRSYIQNNYITPHKMWDLYVPFVEKGIEIIKENGLSAMIIPDTIGKSDYTSKLVNLIEEKYYLYQIDFFPEIYVFKNVGVRSKITFIKKQKSTTPAIKVKHIQNIANTIIVQNNLKGEKQYLLNVANYSINKDNCLQLSDICYVSYGMRLNSDKKDPEKFKKIDLLSEVKDEIHSKVYTEGKYLERYSIKKELFLEYNTERCPSRLVRPTFPELYPPKKLLLSRQKKIAALSEESHYCDNTIIMAIPIYELNKVTNNSIKKYFKNINKDRELIENNSLSYNLYYLLSLINSKLISFHIKYASKGSLDFYPDDWKEIPIFKANDIQQHKLSELSKLRINQENQLNNISNNVLNLIKSKFEVYSLSRKLKNWYELEISQFLKELKKIRKNFAKEKEIEYIKISLSEEADWIQYLNKQKDKYLEIKNRVFEADKEIDQMVYELYGLTNDEIKIVEES